MPSRCVRTFALPQLVLAVIAAAMAPSRAAGQAPAPRATFGESVAITGDTIAVAARAGAGSASGEGAVHVFERTGEQWVESAVLPAPESRVEDPFGISMAADADTIVVGAQFADTTAKDAGLAYVFERRDGRWRPAAVLTAGDASADDQFGLTVSVSGGRIVIGARLKDDAAPDAGAAYVFERTGGTWIQVMKLTASDAIRGDLFGRASLDRDTVLVGADLNDDRGVNAGKAYVLRRRGGEWTEADILHASDATPGSEFGIALALSGPTAVVGAPGRDGTVPDAGAAYVFEERAGRWIETACLTSDDATSNQVFGFAVAAEDDTVVVGAPNQARDGERAGAAYVFERRDGRWVQAARLTASDAAPWRGFGSSVAISRGTVVIGVRGSANGQHPGAAYVFGRRGGHWIEVAKLARR